MIVLTKQQAQRFLLRRHGLLGNYRFEGKQGALSYIRQCGCIQFDPVDVCGKNAELVLQSRVKGFTKAQLHELLYQDRLLFDYSDKNQAILPTEDWPYFERYRQKARNAAGSFEGLLPLTEQALCYIRENGPVSSAELPIKGEIFWHSSIHWSGNWHKPSNAARSVLEQLYTEGTLVIHHKEGSRKYYDLAERCISPALLGASDPLPDDFDHLKWRILRRIGAVGLMWDRPSDAWLNIAEQQSGRFDAAQRSAAFASLLAEGKLMQLRVEGIRDVLYCRIDELPLLEEAMVAEYRPRCELLAPLDCLLWDRKLFSALFGFDYSWEIYTPEEKRKYGYYVLPMLYGDRFIGRVEAVPDRKTGILSVKHIWFEADVRRTKKLMNTIHSRLRRFGRFNGCSETVFPE